MDWTGLSDNGLREVRKMEKNKVVPRFLLE